MSDPRLDRDDPDYDAEAEEAMCEFFDEQDREWDEREAQNQYNEGRT